MSRLTDQMAQSAAWLCHVQDKASGGWAEEPGRHPSPLNTAEALIALVQADRESVGTDVVCDGVKFLRDSQATAGGHAGAWCHVSDDKNAHPDVMRTGLVLEALMLAQVKADDVAVDRALDWLLRVRNDDGGWGFSGGRPTRILPTCQVLLGLAALTEAGRDLRAPIIEGVNFLLGHARRPAGFFSCNDSAGLLASPHTIYSTLVLQKARRLGFTDMRPERAAIDWLLKNQDEARRLVTEEIELDEHERYDFLYVTDSLLIRVLTGSTNKQDRSSTLYRAALYSIRDRIEPAHGGSYGFRLFSWSTARVISAMSAAAPIESDFPSRPAEYSGTRARPWLTGLMVVILVLATVLGLADAFSAEVAGLFALLTLGMLLINGFIGEKTFAEIASRGRSATTGGDGSG